MTEERHITNPEEPKSSSSLTNSIYLVLGSWFFASEAIKTNHDDIEQAMELFEDSEDEFFLVENRKNQIKYALLGVVLSSPELFAKRFRKTRSLTDRLLRKASSITRPLSSSRIMAPLNNGFDKLVQRGETIVQEYAEIGRRGEKFSEVYTNQTFENLVDKTVDNVASRPEIRELVQQQSLGMAEELSEEIHDRFSAADSILERIVFKLIPGVKKDTTPIVEIPILENENDRLFRFLEQKTK